MQPLSLTQITNSDPSCTRQKFSSISKRFQQTDRCGFWGATMCFLQRFKRENTNCYYQCTLSTTHGSELKEHICPARLRNNLSGFICCKIFSIINTIQQLPVGPSGFPYFSQFSRLSSSVSAWYALAILSNWTGSPPLSGCNVLLSSRYRFFTADTSAP